MKIRLRLALIALTAWSQSGLLVSGVDFGHRYVREQVAHALVADIDGDGHNDIVLHDHRDDYHLKDPNRRLGLAWLRWPNFVETRIFEGPVGGDRFAVADVNIDGRRDVVSTRYLTGNEQALFWYENPGAGTSTLWTEHRVGRAVLQGEVKDVAAGDVNGDGRCDLVVRCLLETWLFFQTTDGWKDRRLSHVAREGLALADLDRDGDLDIILNGFWFETPADLENGEFHRHSIDEKWFAQKTGSWQDNACTVAAGDLNEDGIVDVVISHSETTGYPLAWYSVSDLAKVKTGPWVEHRIAPTFDWCETVQVGDVDNDGHLDVVAAKFQRHDKPGGRTFNSPPFPVTVFLNSAGDGEHWRRQDIAQDGVYYGVLGDVGSDGDLDLVGPQSYWKGPIRLWENKTSDQKLALDRWTYIQVDDHRGKYGDFAQPGWAKYFGLAMADLSGHGNGLKDIVSGRYFYRNPGGDMAGKWTRTDLGANVDACLVVDVNSNDRADFIAMALPDLFWVEAADHSASSWTLRKVASAPRTDHANSQGFASGQIIPGGKPEIVFATQQGVFYFPIPPKPEDGEWPRTLITREASDEGIDLADVDGDGLPDLVAGNGEQYLAWWKNPGNGSPDWPRHIIGTTAPHPVDRVRARDLNGDGRVDIVVTEERYPGKEPDANLYWFEQPANPAATSWPRHRLITTWSLNNLDTADVDHDGDVDIVTCEHKGKDFKLYLFENDGRGRFTERVLDQGKESHLGTQFSDLDGDGDLDLVSIAWDKHQFIHLWRNDALVRRPTAP